MSDTTTLVRALRILARDIHCEDGIATQCITEAADAIERLRSRVRFCDNVIRSGDVAALTGEEREAIRMARSIMVVEHDLSVGDEFHGKQPRRSSGYWWGMVSALHSLLKRLGGPDE
jgi:hypothetical protein